MRVAVLAGGPSSEHAVSLQSSREMLGQLQAGGHAVRPVLIDEDADERWRVGAVGAGFDATTPATGRREALETLWKQGEIACLGLHGPWGEDGTVQRILEDAGIPYTGSGPEASALSMDKELSKRAASEAGAHTARHEVLSGTRLPAWGIGIQRGNGYPCFVKPVSAGSSVGITRVEDEDGLREAVALAQAEDAHGRCMVEELIDGPELTCAVLRRDGELATLPLIAIEPAETFYDYHAKYESEETRFICPAPVDEAVRHEIEDVCRTLYERLELRGVVRVDFMQRRDTQVPVFLELNTLPGFTSHSLVPLAARTAGWTALELLEAVLADVGGTS